MNNPEPTVWYAMRVTYQREMSAKRFLDELLIENFIPMCYKIYLENKQKKRKLVPAIHNLIFVRTTQTQIKQVKSRLSYLQYMIRTDGNQRVPIVIPEKQMQQFITVVGSPDEQLIYLNLEEINLKKGTRVRIHGGLLDGLEGLFVRVKGVRNKRLVIMVQDIVAVATTIVSPDLIEVLD